MDSGTNSAASSKTTTPDSGISMSKDKEEKKRYIYLHVPSPYSIDTGVSKRVERRKKIISYLRNRRHVLCFSGVTETPVGDWENSRKL